MIRRLSPPLFSIAMLAACGVLAACGDDTSSPGNAGGGGGGGEAGCPEGFAEHAEACRPVFADECPPGHMPAIGNPECVPVGWHDCPAELIAADWGCVDGLPAAPCQGATRDAIGGRCVPVGDCGAAFPPAEATLFVDDDYGPGELDATHFATIGDALAAATPGTVIAVDSGTYVEGLTLSQGVTVIGRCAGEVLVDSPGGVASGIYHADGTNVEVRGMTLTGHRGGAIALGGRLRIVQSVLDHNREIGVLVAEVGATLEIVESVIRDTTAAANGALGRGVDVEIGGRVELIDSAVVQSREVAVLVTDPGSSGLVTGSVVRSTLPDGSMLNGRGLVARQGATLEVARSAIVDSRDIGVFASGANTLLRLDESVVRATELDESGLFGRGVSAISGARIEVTRSTVADNHSTGIVVEDPGSSVLVEDTTVVGTEPDADGTFGVGLFVRVGTSAEVRGSAFVSNTDFGVVANGATLVVEGSLVQATRPTPSGAHGDGVLSFGGASLELVDSAVIDHHGTGIFVSLDGADAHVERTIVHGVQPTVDTGIFGFGMLAAEGRLDITASSVSGAASAGVAFDAATGVVSASTLWSNTIGLQVQNGSSVIEIGPEGGEPAPLQVLLTNDTRFVDNERRLGAEVVPVPSAEDLLPEPP